MAPYVGPVEIPSAPFHYKEDIHAMIHTTLVGDMQMPQCTICSHDLFCRDALVEHQVALDQNGSLSLHTHQLGLEVIQHGVRHCNITCAHCLQQRNREIK